MARITIACDIDEVLMSFGRNFLEYYNQQRGTAFAFESLSAYFIEELTGDTQEVILTMLDDYLKTDAYLQADPIESAVTVLQELSKRYNFVVITARDDFFRGSTEDFLERHFSELFKVLRYTHAEDDNDAKQPKHEICAELGATILIDDNLTNVTEVAEHGMTGILFGDYPWNQASVLPKGVIRCVDWPAVREYLNGR